MLLWWALVISSILPTRSVVETPCVRLHSLGRQQQALQPHTDPPPPPPLGRAQQDSLRSPVPARLLHLLVGVFAVHRERDII